MTLQFLKKIGRALSLVGMVAALSVGTVWAGLGDVCDIVDGSGESDGFVIWDGSCQVYDPISNGSETPSFVDDLDESSMDVPINGSVKLKVEAVSDEGDVTYQWYSTTAVSAGTDSKIVVGGDESEFTVPSSTKGTYYYFVMAINTETGKAPVAVKSNVITIEVKDASALPSFGSSGNLSTTSQDVANGATKQLTVTVTSAAGAVTYQWYSTTATTSGTDTKIDGATGPSYTIPTTTNATYYYFVMAINTEPGKVPTALKSNIAPIVVKDGSARPVFTDDLDTTPVDVAVGDTKALTVAIEQTSGITYQWFKIVPPTTETPEPSPQMITGATGNSYTVPSTTTAGMYYFWVEVTNTESDKAPTTGKSSVATINVRGSRVVGITATGNVVSGSYAGLPSGTAWTSGTKNIMVGTTVRFEYVGTIADGSGVSWTGAVKSAGDARIATLMVEAGTGDISVGASVVAGGLNVSQLSITESDYTGIAQVPTFKVTGTNATSGITEELTAGTHYSTVYRKTNDYVNSTETRANTDAGTVYVFVTGIGTWANKTNGAQLSGNSFKINKKALTIENARATKVYDGTKDIANGAVTNVRFGSGGVQVSDAVSFTVTEAEYASAAAGTTEIKVKAGTVDGVQGPNYAVAIPSGGLPVTLVGATEGAANGITKKALDIASARHTKVYDGEKKAEGVVLQFNEGAAAGRVLAADRSKLGAMTVEAEYTSQNAGTVTINVSAAEFTGSGTAAGNYSITLSGLPVDVTEGTGTKKGITKKDITIRTGGHEVNPKTYNGSRVATVTAVAFDGLVEGEDFKIGALNGTSWEPTGADYLVTGALFKDINAGESKEISAGTVTLNASGDKAKNYALGTSTAARSLASKGATGTIEKKELPLSFVSLKEGLQKTYTGSAVTLTTTGSSPELRVVDNVMVDGKTIILATRDYTVTYENNVSAGSEATVIVEAKESGNYYTDGALEMTFTIGKKEISVKAGGHTVDTRYFDGTDVAPVSAVAFTGLVAGDVLYISTEDEEGDYEVVDPVYASVNAGNSKPVTGGYIALTGTDVANNYRLKDAAGNGRLNIGSGMKLSGNVLRKPLKVSDITVDSKIYDGSDTVKVSAVTLVDENDEEVEIPYNASNGYVVAGAKYEDASAGVDKLIVAGKVTLKGTAAGQTAANYAIDDPNIGEKGFKGTVEKRLLVINDAASQTVISKQYDGTPEIVTENVALKFKTGTTGEGLVAKDAALVAEGYRVEGGRFDDATVGNSKSVTGGTVVLEGGLAANYTLESASIGGFTGKITKRAIGVSSATHTKVYDGNTSAAGLLFGISADAAPGYAGDVMSEIDTVYTAVYTSKNAGTKTVRFTKLAFKSTAPAELKASYEIDLTKVFEMADGGITPKSVAIATVSHTKPYDGTTDAEVTNMTFDGLVTGDAANTVLVDKAEAAYVSPMVGTKELTVSSVTLKGSNGVNYEVEVDPSVVWTVAGNPAGIVGRTLVIDSIRVSKTYDALATVESDSVTVVFRNVAEVDVPFTSYTVSGVTFQNAAAGVGKTITGGTVALTGLALENYVFSATAGTLAGKGYKADIRQKAVAVESVAHTKAYDGNKNAVGVQVTLDRSAFIGADTAITVGSVVAEYTDAMFGTKTLNVIRVNLAGTNNANYAVAPQFGVTVEGITGVAVESISVSGPNGVDSISGSNKTLQLTAAVLPADASIKAVKWTVSDESIATVSASGLVTAKKNGTVTVTASAQDTTKVTGTINVTITSVGVAEVAREIPTQPVVTEEAVVKPVAKVAASFVAGPNVASKASGKVTFFSSKPVKAGGLYIFDKSGNVVAKIAAKAGTGAIGSWNLKDAKGAPVAEGTYVSKGVLIGKDGKREKVSTLFTVVR